MGIILGLLFCPYYYHEIFFSGATRAPVIMVDVYRSKFRKLAKKIEEIHKPRIKFRKEKYDMTRQGEALSSLIRYSFLNRYLLI